MSSAGLLFHLKRDKNKVNPISNSTPILKNFSNFTKGLLVLGCALTILGGYAFLRSYSSSLPKHKIFIQWAGLGEYELAQRVEKACKKLGWDVTVCCGREQLTPIEASILPSSISPHSISSLIEEKKPDFILNFKDLKTLSPGIPNYLTVFGDDDKYFISRKDISTVLNYDGILHPSPSVDLLKHDFQKSGKPFHSIRWYPSCVKTEYQANPKPNQIFYCGFQWDKKRTGPEYRKLFSLLDEQKCFTVYGPLDKWNFIPLSAKGLLPFDGSSIERAIREAGIALVIHTDEHIKLGAPTSRIFEAAAACAVTICDQHPFVKQEFGDCVLYIDGEKSGEEMFRQVYDHYKWILSHPKQAEQMARRFHTLFVKKFTLESQMAALGKMHAQVLQSRKNK
jgi:hypothetical protein